MRTEKPGLRGLSEVGHYGVIGVVVGPLVYWTDILGNVGMYKAMVTPGLVIRAGGGSGLMSAARGLLPNPVTNWSAPVGAVGATQVMGSPLGMTGGPVGITALGSDDKEDFSETIMQFNAYLRGTLLDDSTNYEWAIPYHEVVAENIMKFSSDEETMYCHLSLPGACPTIDGGLPDDIISSFESPAPNWFRTWIYSSGPPNERGNGKVSPIPYLNKLEFISWVKSRLPLKENLTPSLKSTLPSTNRKAAVRAVKEGLENDRLQSAD